MNIKEMIVAGIREHGGDGIVNLECQCGCGDHDGWYLCECCNLEDCRPAKWAYCRDCKHNGKCNLQEEYEYTGHENEGCYRVLKTPEENDEVASNT